MQLFVLLIPFRLRNTVTTETIALQFARNGCRSTVEHLCLSWKLLVHIASLLVLHMRPNRAGWQPFAIAAFCCLWWLVQLRQHWHTEQMRRFIGRRFSTGSQPDFANGAGGPNAASHSDEAGTTPLATLKQQKRWHHKRNPNLHLSGTCLNEIKFVSLVCVEPTCRNSEVLVRICIIILEAVNDKPELSSSAHEASPAPVQKEALVWPAQDEKNLTALLVEWVFWMNQWLINPAPSHEWCPTSSRNEGTRDLQTKTRIFSMSFAGYWLKRP